MPETVGDLRARLGSVDYHRTRHQETWEQLGEYFAPHRTGFINERNDDYKRTQNIFCSSPIERFDNFVSLLYGSLVPSETEWWKSDIEGVDARKDRHADEWTQNTEYNLNRVFNRSNFRSMVHQTVYDYALFGTGALGIYEAEPMTGRLRFENVPLQQLYPEENNEGIVNRLIRRYQLPVQHLIDYWPQAAEAADIRALIQQKRMWERVWVNLSCHPAGDEPKLNPRHKVIVKVWLDCHDDFINSTRGRFPGYHEFPYAVPRFSRIGESPYGYSKSVIALADTKTMNQLRMLALKGLAKDVDPPVLARHDSIMGRLHMGSGEISFVNKKAKTLDDALKVHTVNRRWDAESMYDERLAGEIAGIFVSDRTNFIAQRRGPNMTAAEIDAILQGAMQALAPIVARFDTEFINVIVGRAFAINSRVPERHRQIPPPPPSVQGREIRFRAVGPLFQAQRMNQIFGMEQLLTWGQQAGTIFTDMPLAVDGANFMRVGAEILDVPRSVLRSPQEVRQILEDRAAQEQQMAQMEQMEKMANAAGKVGYSIGGSTGSPTGRR